MSMEEVKMMDVLHMQSVSEHSGLDHANSTETLQGFTCQNIGCSCSLPHPSSHILYLYKDLQ